MTEDTDSDVIVEAASRFLRLREDGDDQTRDALRQWMALDIRHAAAIDLVERGWSNAAVLATPMPNRLLLRRSNARQLWKARQSVSPRRLGLVAGLTAAIAILVGLEYHGRGLGWPHTYETHGAAQDVTLKDGSLLRLQPHSQAVVRISLFARAIALNAGGGAFVVAHEAARPFVVGAGKIGVEATGTRFTVATNAAGTHVALWQGGVRLRDRTSDAVIAYLKPGDRVHIGSGNRVILSHVKPMTTSPSTFVFEDTPLANAIAQIADGTRLRIRFARPKLAHLPVSSIYHGHDLASFLDDLSNVESICWRQRGTTVEIFERSRICSGSKDLATDPVPRGNYQLRRYLPRLNP